MLELFAPHADLLRGGDRCMNKTGTLEGGSTLAGYADTSSQRPVGFAISVQPMTAGCDSDCFGATNAMSFGA